MQTALGLFYEVPNDKNNTNLNQLIGEVTLSHQPIPISSDHNNAVLVAEEDWTAIQETLFLSSVPNMSHSIHEGMATSVRQCDHILDW